MSIFRGQDDIPVLTDSKLNDKYVGIIEDDLTNKKASILSSTMFNHVFKDENNLKYPCKLLAYLSDMSYDELSEKLRIEKDEFDVEDIEDEDSYEKDTGIRRANFELSFDNQIISVEINRCLRPKTNKKITTFTENMIHAFTFHENKIKKIGRSKHLKFYQFSINNFAYEGDKNTISINSLQNSNGNILDDRFFFVQIYVPNLLKKYHTSGLDGLDDTEKYLLLLIQSSIEKSKKIAGDDPFMEDYVKDATIVSNEEWFRDAYNKELESKK